MKMRFLAFLMPLLFSVQPAFSTEPGLSDAESRYLAVLSVLLGEMMSQKWGAEVCIAEFPRTATVLKSSVARWEVNNLSAVSELQRRWDSTIAALSPRDIKGSSGESLSVELRNVFPSAQKEIKRKIVGSVGSACENFVLMGEQPPFEKLRKELFNELRSLPPIGGPTLMDTPQN